jgi:hypothetical protein
MMRGLMAVTVFDRDNRMDAKQFADEIVEPTIAEFESDPRSRRRAFLACVATFHLMDYIPKSSRQKYQRECRAFAAVDRYAHAFKHRETGHPDDPLIQPLKPEQVIERPPAIWDQAVWDLSLWDDAAGGVTIAGEHRWDLLADAKEAAAFLRSKLPP